MILETLIPCDHTYKLGVFTYTLNGESKTDDFEIKAPVLDDSEPERKNQAMDIYNEELARAWQDLTDLGAKDIHYNEIHPCMLF